MTGWARTRVGERVTLVCVGVAMDRIGALHEKMWDEQDGFFYDVLRLPDGNATRLKVRSMVGLLPLCATAVLEADMATSYPRLTKMIALFKKRHPTSSLISSQRRPGLSDIEGG